MGGHRAAASAAGISIADSIATMMMWAKAKLVAAFVAAVTVACVLGASLAMRATGPSKSQTRKDRRTTVNLPRVPDISRNA